MSTKAQLQNNTIITVFGASGDLAMKKIFPALFGLYSKGFLPADVHIVGYAGTKMDDEQFLKRETQYIKNPNNDEAKSTKIAEFKKLSSYISGGYDDAAAFKKLNEHLVGIESNYQSKNSCNRVFYLALPDENSVDVAKNTKAECYSTTGVNRIIVASPNFGSGTNMQSCRAFVGSIGQYWSNEETFLIEPYLGKEIVRNILVFRFANFAIGALLDRNSVSNVQITFKQPHGTEGRGGAFDKFGIIRDVLLPHLTQVLSLLTMERPASLSAKDIHDEKAKVLSAVVPANRREVLLGQYTAANGKPGYLDDDTVPVGSTCPTFAAVALYIENPRWEGVPFIMTAGKALDENKVEIRIQFKDNSQEILSDVRRNELVIRILPSPAVFFRINTKPAGAGFATVPIEMGGPPAATSGDGTPEAYESLIHEVLRGNQSCFVQGEELDMAWRIFTPVLDWVDRARPQPEGYPYGSSGPPDLDDFIAAHDGPQ